MNSFHVTLGRSDASRDTYIYIYIYVTCISNLAHSEFTVRYDILRLTPVQIHVATDN